MRAAQPRTGSWPLLKPEAAAKPGKPDQPQGTTVAADRDAFGEGRDSDACDHTATLQPNLTRRR